MNVQYSLERPPKRCTASATPLNLTSDPNAPSGLASTPSSSAAIIEMDNVSNIDDIDGNIVSMRVDGRLARYRER